MSTASTEIRVPISPGELIDKITILEIKSERMSDAKKVANVKHELSLLFTAEIQRVKAARAIIAQSLPEALDKLRRRHDAFQSLLQTNLTVLATAHAVSEGIIRGVSGELARKAAPSTYGANGRANLPSSKTSQPMSVFRSL